MEKIKGSCFDINIPVHYNLNRGFDASFILMDLKVLSFPPSVTEKYNQALIC